MSTHPHGSENVGSESSDPTARRRRRRALLAGGLVVGLGAVATMAAYSDNEFASGKFSAGKFGIQGSESTSTTYNWADHASADAAAPLSFSTGFNLLQPGTTVYAPFTLRVDPNRNTYDARVVLANSTATAPDSGAQALLSRLTYSANLVSDPTQCNASGMASPAYGLPSGVGFLPVKSNFNTSPNSSAFTLPKSSATNTVCLAVTMADQGNSETLPDFGTSPVTATWQFSAKPV